MLLSIGAMENETLMQTMRATVHAQHDPKVGMFWYNPARDVLVGVHSVFAAELPFNARGRKTMQVLHHTAWPGVCKAAKAIGSSDAIWDEEDYTLVPRGRVFEIAVSGDAPYFEVLVGSWAEDYPHVLAMIAEEFNLLNTKHDFIHSRHWDIGRGTSEIFV
jgi:hypothetical protein